MFPIMVALLGPGPCQLPPECARALSAHATEPHPFDFAQSWLEHLVAVYPFPMACQAAFFKLTIGGEVQSVHADREFTDFEQRLIEARREREPLEDPLAYIPYGGYFEAASSDNPGDLPIIQPGEWPPGADRLYPMRLRAERNKAKYARE